jgi:hypothetical protein
MKVGNPTQSPAAPSCATVFLIASKIFLYGSLPSASGTYFCNFVLALSNGRLIAEATPPAKKLAMKKPVNG